MCYQCCIVHFYRNAFSVVPRGKIRTVSMMLKAIHSQESKESVRTKARDVYRKLLEMRLPLAAKKVEAGIEETLTFMKFPSKHWSRIRTNNMLERVMKRRTRSIGAFPDGQSTLMLACARLRHAVASEWVLTVI